MIGRQELIDAREGCPLESSVVLAKFQQLYDIEDRAKTFSPEERLALREAEARPIWTSLGEWLDSEAAARVLPKSRFAEAPNAATEPTAPATAAPSAGLPASRPRPPPRRVIPAMALMGAHVWATQRLLVRWMGSWNIDILDILGEIR